MEKVKAGLRGLSAEAKWKLAGAVYNKMNGNPHFPNPVPSMATLLVTTDALGKWCTAAVDKGRFACAMKKLATKELDQVLSRLSAYVNSTAMGNVEVLMSSGFSLTRKHAPISHIEAPVTLGFRNTGFLNKVEYHWRGVDGALMYEVEKCMDQDTINETWERLKLTSKTSLVVDRTQNTQGIKYRVRALGTREEGPYSQVTAPAAN